MKKRGLCSGYHFFHSQITSVLFWSLCWDLWILSGVWHQCWEKSDGNVIRIQHIFNNPLRFLGLLVLFIWKSVYNRVCMCWCNLIFSEQVNRGLSPCFLSSCWTTTWRPESSGCGMGWLPWLFPSAAHQSGGFCSLNTGRECVLIIKRWWNWLHSSCNTVSSQVTLCY